MNYTCIFQIIIITIFKNDALSTVTLNGHTKSNNISSANQTSIILYKNLHIY